MNEITAIILAAGKGKRMNSDLPKVLHPVGGRPMVVFPFLAAWAAGCRKVVFIVPADYQIICEAVSPYVKDVQAVSYACQPVPRGTGDAVKCALARGAKGTILVLSGDMPLIGSATIKTLLSAHAKNGNAMTLLSVIKADPSGFGRILRDRTGALQGIIEEKDASPTLRQVNEVNVGVYAFDATFLRAAIRDLNTSNAQKEYYLTDLAACSIKRGRPVGVVTLKDVGESLGANSRLELSAVNREFSRRRRRTLEFSGTRLVGDDIHVDADSHVAPDATLESPCYVRGKSVIESGVTIETGCVLKSSTVCRGAHLKAYCYLDGAIVDKNCHVGPFAHLRPGTRLKAGARIGNFVETKNTIVGEGSKANHLSYLGDATIGRGANIGAGTITCNYDGVRKLQTVIGDGAFIGSDTQLVAPVRIGKGSYVGAGTTVTKDVSANSLVVSRVAQNEIPDWASKRRQKNKSHSR